MQLRRELVFADRELVALAGLDHHPSLPVFDQLTGHREIEEAMPEPVSDLLHQSAERPVQFAAPASIRFHVSHVLTIWKMSV